MRLNQSHHPPGGLPWCCSLLWPRPSPSRGIPSVSAGWSASPSSAVIVLLARWRGLPVTTILYRRLAILRPNRVFVGPRTRLTDVRTTALLRVTPPLADADVIAAAADRRLRRALRSARGRHPGHQPRQHLRSRHPGAGDLDRRDAVCRRQSRCAAGRVRRRFRCRRPPRWRRVASPITCERAAGRHRSPSIDDVPTPYPRNARETWSGISLGGTDYIAAHGVKVDTALPNTLAAIWSYPVREVWTVLEVAGAGADQTLAVGCAFRTDASAGRERAASRV